MRHIFPQSITALALLVSLVLGACSEERLDIEQKGSVPYDEYFKTDDDAVSTLAQVYYVMDTKFTRPSQSIYSPPMVLWNMGADDYLGGGTYFGDNDFVVSMNEFRYDTANEVVFNAYCGYYAAIYPCNLVINHFQPDTPVKRQCVAEARVVRAYCHFMLAMGWGTPPLVTTELNDEEAKNLTNYSSQRDLYLWCAREAEEAADDLEERESVTDRRGTVRVTKGFAQALAGKAYLFADMPEKAKTLLRSVVESGKYALVPTERWAENFHATGDCNEEKVFEVNHAAQGVDVTLNVEERGTWWHYALFNWRTDRLAAKPAWMAVSGWGAGHISKTFAEWMLAHEGDSPRRKATFWTEDEFFYEQQWYDNDDTPREEKMRSDRYGIKDPRGLWGMEPYFEIKRIANKSDNSIFDFPTEGNLPIMRYAEVLFLYAEACALTSDDDGLGLRVLNDIQRRAGAPVSPSLTLEAVQREKQLEMWNEGVRWADMLRWGDYDPVIETRGSHVPTLYDAFFTKGEPVHRLYVEYTNPQKPGVEFGFKAGKHNLFPFPANVLRINKKLQQNDGWR